MPKVFEGETKYFTLVSENLVKFVKMGSTQKADLTKDLDEIKVLKTVKITYDTYGTIYMLMFMISREIKQFKKLKKQFWV